MGVRVSHTPFCLRSQEVKAPNCKSKDMGSIPIEDLYEYRSMVGHLSDTEKTKVRFFLLVLQKGSSFSKKNPY